MVTISRIARAAFARILPFAALMLSLPAYSGLIGSQVTIAVGEAQPAQPLTFIEGPQTLVIADPGYELRGYAGLFDIDIGDDFIRIDVVASGVARPASFLGLLLQDFTNVNVLGIREVQSTATGFDASRILFDPSAELLGFNFQGLNLTAGQAVAAVLDFETVPIPGTLMLLGFGGLLGIAVRARIA